MDNVDIRGKFPKIYADFVEIDKLAEAEQKIFEEFRTHLSQLVDKQWVLTSTEEGIAQYEEAFGIQSYPEDTLEFRRDRVINRLSAAPPYTYRHLLQRMSSFVGQQNYLVSVVYGDYEIVFIIRIGEKGKLDEFIKTMIDILPANLKSIVVNGILCYNTTVSYVGQGVDTTLVYTVYERS